MIDINTVALTGRVVAPPSIKEINDKKLANFAIAVNGFKEYTSFIECNAWGKLAGILEQYLTKGMGVTINGKLRQERWKDSEGRSKSRVSVECIDVVFQTKQDRVPQGTQVRDIIQDQFQGKQIFPEEHEGFPF